MSKRFRKTLIQDCVIFIGLIIVICSIPFCIISYNWSQSIGFILCSVGFIFVSASIVHKIIFGDTDYD